MRLDQSGVMSGCQSGASWCPWWLWHVGQGQRGMLNRGMMPVAPVWIWGRDCAGLCCWGTYAYMHICTKSIQIYFGIFLDFILVLLSFHCSHTVPIFPNFSLFFLPFYSLQKHVTLTQHCWFCFCLSTCVPMHHAESNHIIRNVHAHLGTLSGVEAGGRNRVYVGWDTHSHFPPQCSDSHWGGENPLFLFLYCIN